MIKNQDNKVQFISIILGAIVLGFFLCTQVLAASPQIIINSGNNVTGNRMVTLRLTGPSDAQQMRISNKNNFSDVNWEPYRRTKSWLLDFGASGKTVYAQFRNSNGEESAVVSDRITLSVASTDVDFVINEGKENTNSRYVTLNLSYSEGVEAIQISNKNNFEGIDTQPISNSLKWILSSKSGEKTVYIRFIDANNNSSIVSRKITYTEPPRYIPEGTVLKGQTGTIYYFGYDGKLHPYLTNAIYHSWFSDFSNITRVSNKKLQEYQIGQPMTVRPGTWLVRFRTSPRIYAVEPGHVLRELLSHVEGKMLYGENWEKRVLVLDDIFEPLYTVRGPDDSMPLSRIDDPDRDFVDKDTERQYGTSNDSRDTDNDGLSDYEEIYYWFTDPLKPDTDDDSFSDGDEILAGYSPIGTAALNVRAPEDTYSYPAGTLVQPTGDTEIFYRHYSGKFYTIGRTTEATGFRKNKFQESFLLRTLTPIEFKRNTYIPLTKELRSATIPTITVNGQITAL